MAAPSKYVPSYDFSDFQTSNPSDPPPGDQLDAQFDALKSTTDQTIDALGNVRRSDGALVNGIVTVDSLSTAVIALLNDEISPRGAWVTARAYAVNDLVSQNNVPYLCIVAHTSGTFATDLAAGKWQALGPNAIAVDGSSTVAADIPFGAHKLTGVAAGVSGTDAVNVTQATALAAAAAAAATPDATSSIKGKVQLAVAAEAQVGTDTAKALTADAAASLWAAGADNAGGATITLGDGGSFNLITSTTAITAFAFTNDRAGRTARIRFNTIRTLTHNATSLIIPGGASITTAAGDTCEIESLGSGNFRVNRYTPAASSTALPVGFFRGLVISNNGSDANNDIDIATGKARSSDDTADLVLAAGLTKQLDAAWAVGTNAGGLFSGSKANSTWYHVFLIKRTDTGVVDAGFDTSATAANIPSPYTKYRRLGSVLTDGSGNIRAFVAYGAGASKEFYWSTSQIDINAANPGTAAVSRTLSTPLGVKTKALMSVGAFNNSNTTVPVFVVSDLAWADVAPDALTTTALAGSGGMVSAVDTNLASGWSWAQAAVWTNTASQVRSRASASDATARVAIITRGWADDL